MIPEDRTELFTSGLDMFIAVFHDNQRFIALHIGCNRTSAHVGLIAKNGIANVVVMRCLNIIKQNDIL